eukprot:7322155-Prymnesium_polylepis.1
MRVKVETRTRSMCTGGRPVHTRRGTQCNALPACVPPSEPAASERPTAVHVATRPRTVRGACRSFVAECHSLQ